MKLFNIIIALSLVCVMAFSGCGNSSTKIKINEVTHSIFYAPLYIAINNDYFKDEGIDVELINVNTIKPLDEKTILDSVKKTNHVVVCDNHNVIGGLYSAVCELLCSKYPLKVGAVGVKDRFGQVGSYNDLLKDYSMTPLDICNTVKENLK